MVLLIFIVCALIIYLKLAKFKHTKTYSCFLFCFYPYTILILTLIAVRTLASLVIVLDSQAVFKLILMVILPQSPKC